MSLLKVTDLKKHFGGVRALDGVSFTVQSGECVALIGPNGAGKSTCFATLAGQHRPGAGTVEWGTGAQADVQLHNVTGLSAAALSARGIGRTFQVAQVFEALTVLQNLQLATRKGRGFQGFGLLAKQHTASSQALLAQLGLEQVAHTTALALPYGLKKRLELGIALAAKPQLLLLDEPAAGLAEQERAALMALVKNLTMPTPNQPQAQPQPLAVLYTEHNMDAVFGIADRVLVLIDGQLAAQGTAQEVAHNPLVRQRYLGRTQGGQPEGQRVGQLTGQIVGQIVGHSVNQPAIQPAIQQAISIANPIANSHALPAGASESAPAVLSIDNLSAWWGPAQALFNVSLQVGTNELVVLKGLNGAGKSTLLQAIMGCGPRNFCTSSYQINSKKISLQNGAQGLPSHQRARLGLGYVPEDRRLFAALTVQQNLRIACSASPADTAQREARVLDLFPALKTMLHRPAAHMSGGEQQMLALARTLMAGPSLLLLDEPCEGIAPVLVEHMASALLQLKSQGVPMLVAEQNPILADHADRVLTLAAGRL